MRAIDKPAFTVRIEPALVEALAVACEEQRRGRSVMIEVALEAWLKEHGYYEPAPSRRKVKAESRVAA